MSRDIFEIVRQMDVNSAEVQLALQCAPLLAGLKISNLLNVHQRYRKYVCSILRETGISGFILRETEERITFLLYREVDLMQYLSSQKVRRILGSFRYDSPELAVLLCRLSERYRDYEEGKSEFPHELGLFLGYPVEDVTGFIHNRGKNFLCIGDWKVYEDMTAKMELFRRFECAREAMIQMVFSGTSIRKAIEVLNTGSSQAAQG